ncbi:MAG: T9SS type A sorting domain-containing protein [Bacteroidales bacterium]|nr:T9SS type A sorting domain-containing protein [Bacteroidales bacterium]MCF8403570.1 T9SS type A sorting domain-containing protein [Bacteroidales bacterium]
MKSIFLVFIILFCSQFPSKGQEAIYAIVENDTVTIWHVETYRNCASSYVMEFGINGNEINLFQVDTIGPIALCMCYFDLSATLTNLLPAYYEVDVYSVGDGTSINDTTFWGSTSFTILSGDGLSELIAGSQSPCYDPNEIKEIEFAAQVKVYPNPAVDYIIIEFPLESVQVCVKDILGNTVISEENYRNNSRIDLTDIKKGFYFVCVLSEGKMAVKKIFRI